MKKKDIILLIISILLIGITVLLFCLGSNYSYFPLLIGIVLINFILGQEKHIVKKIYLVLYTIIFIADLLFSINVIKAPSTPITDYDKRIEIWEDTIPGNSKNLKINDMNVRKNTNKLLSMNRFLTFLYFKNEKNAESVIDTYTYSYEIRSGYAKETYEDVPYLIPYLVDSAKDSVIILPGGGFANKSIEDGGTLEGKNVALALNERGINAFVLWYRSNPYEFPVPQADLQRAVKYLKYHKDDFGIDENRISIIGFSAGGYVVSSYINLFMGGQIVHESDTYTYDDIDLMDDKVYTAALIYPELTFKDNYSIMYSCFDREKIQDESIRNSLIDKYDTIKHMKSSVTKEYIAYGDKDDIVGTDNINEYISKARETDKNITVKVCENQKHAFDTDYYINHYVDFLLD